MAELEETLQESKEESSETSHTDLLMAIPAPLGSEILPPTVEKLLQACELLSAPCQIVLALPAEKSKEVPTQLPEADSNKPAPHPLRYVSYTLPPAVPGMIQWLPSAATYRELARLAVKLGARACTVLGTDSGFNRASLTAEKLTLLVDPGWREASIWSCLSTRPSPSMTW